MEQKFRPKLMVAANFICLKIDHLASTKHLTRTVAIRTIIGVTIGISWLSQRDMPRGFARYAAESRFWLILLQPGFKSIGISCCDDQDMPTVSPTIARSAKTHQWIRCRVVTKSAGSEDLTL
jgi:hypothetical protein